MAQVRLYFAAWDRTGGVSGTRVSLALRGGASAFSVQRENATLAVVNVASTLSARTGPLALDNLFSMDLVYAD